MKFKDGLEVGTSPRQTSYLTQAQAKSDHLDLSTATQEQASNKSTVPSLQAQPYRQNKSAPSHDH